MQQRQMADWRLLIQHFDCDAYARIIGTTNANCFTKQCRAGNLISTAAKSIAPLKKQAIAALSKGLGKYQLAGASGARKHGDFFFSQGLNPFATYFPSAMGQINYGSIQLT